MAVLPLDDSNPTDLSAAYEIRNFVINSQSKQARETNSLKSITRKEIGTNKIASERNKRTFATYNHVHALTAVNEHNHWYV
jgi:hypothetical protein